MKIFTPIVLAVAALVAPVTSLAQQAAGRILVAVGEVSILRAAKTIPAPTGTAVLTGDTVQLGARSNAQVRFTDESIVALRPDTAFRVDEYQFREQDAAIGRAFFSLVKGGLRTITGVIGRSNQENYAVRTTTATVGIRGTHYVLVVCDANCLNPDGSQALSGTYGSVTDGRIGVVNKSGETQFGANSFFRVADINTAPVRLLAPPGFLQDVLEGRARRSQSELAATPQPESQSPVQVAVAGVITDSLSPLAPTGSTGSTTGDTRVSSIASTLAAPVALTTTQFQATNQLSTAGPSSIITPGFTGTTYYRINGPFSLPVSCNNPPCSTVTAGQIVLGVNLSLQRATLSTALLDSNGTMFNVGTPLNSGGVPITLSGNQITFSGTLLRSDPLFVEQSGSFRCTGCGPSNNFVDSITISGTISGGIANLTLRLVDAGGAGQITVSLPSATPPNNLGAAMVIQTCTANCTTANPTTAGAVAVGQSLWNVSVNGAGQLTRFGAQDSGGTGPSSAVTNSVGRLTGFVNTAVNTTLGSDATAGNLIWGTWTGPGAKLTDGEYTAYTSGNNQRQPWMVGDLTNTVPASLGTQTYTLIGVAPFASAFSSATQRVNSASLSADFVNRTMSLSVNVTNNASPTNNNTYQSVGSSGISPINGRFSAGFSTTTCTGACNSGVGTPDGSFSGFFTGPQAQGAAVAVTVGYGATASPTTGAGVSGVIGLKR